MSQGLLGSSGRYLHIFWGTFYSWALCVCDKYIHKFIKVATFISQVACYLLWVKVYIGQRVLQGRCRRSTSARNTH